MTLEISVPPCERTQDNHRYADEARRVLADDRSALSWIFPPGKRERVGVLVELGQIALLCGDEMCRAMAQALCTEPTPSTTREAAAKLRRYRLGLPEPAPVYVDYDLAVALWETLDRYLDQHPDLDRAVIDASVG